MKTILVSLCVIGAMAFTANAKSFELASPDGNVTVVVDDSKGLAYSVSFKGQQIINNSPISLTIDNGKTVTVGQKITSAKRSSHNGSFDAFAYKKATVDDNYNAITLGINGGFNLLVRAYDEGVAYRFVAKQKKDFVVVNEQASFNFAKDWNTYFSYVNASGTIEQQYRNSFENLYNHMPISKVDPNTLVFLPALVEADNGVKVVIAESALENYPGLFLLNNGGSSLKGNSAPYPKEEYVGGHNKLQVIVKDRENYIAKATAKQAMPWRIIGIGADEAQLLNSDMVYRLGEPSRLDDTSWIKPGKVAWDWWNDWAVYNVPFKAGINTETYKYYIDFASKYGIEYVILDEGWAVNLQADLFQIIPEIDLKEIVDYGKQKNVGIILWAGFYAFDRDMEHVCKHYSEMGVKGFKVDFIDRDDQRAVDFLYRSAEMAAKYKLMLDFHGVFKPAGLNRTYPNVVNFEGVHGLEQNKWRSGDKYSQVDYDVLLPFIRMYAGQMDYTQGAMLNAVKKAYQPNNSEPMSQGTRTHQLAEYAVFISPLNMLCDSPTHYLQNDECTKFIASFPVVWDETVPLQCKLGEYVAVARRSGNNWYVGAINNWNPVDLVLDLSKLNIGGRKAVVVKDGPSAEKVAADHLHETITIPADGKVKVHLAPGGGFVLHTF